MGNRLLSDFSFEVSMYYVDERDGARVAGIGNGEKAELTRFFEQRHIDLLSHHHLLGNQELSNLFI